MERDIIDKLMDFERCGLTAGERVNMRECAAIEIHKLRRENERMRSVLEIIAGSSDRLQALQATAALDNIGPTVTKPDAGAPFFLTQWEREDYEREKRGEKPLGPRT